MNLGGIKVVKYKVKAYSNPFRYSFSLHIVRKWTKLPRSVVGAEIFTKVKTALKRFLSVYYSSVLLRIYLRHIRAT